MSKFARQFQPPRGCKVVTSGTLDDCTKDFDGQTHLPQFGIVKSGTGDLELLYRDDVTGSPVQGDVVPVAPGDYLGGGFETLGAASDPGIVVVLWY